MSHFIKSRPFQGRFIVSEVLFMLLVAVTIGLIIDAVHVRPQPGPSAVVTPSQQQESLGELLLPTVASVPQTETLTDWLFGQWIAPLDAGDGQTSLNTAPASAGQLYDIPIANHLLPR